MKEGVHREMFGAECLSIKSEEKCYLAPYPVPNDAPILLRYKTRCNAGQLTCIASLASVSYPNAGLSYLQV